MVCKASASAGVISAKLTPPIRRRNISQAKAAAISPGNRKTLTIDTKPLLNMLHHQGSSVTPLHIMKSGSSPTPSPLSLRRSEEHTPELQSLMRISYAVFCLKKKTLLLHFYIFPNSSFYFTCSSSLFLL